MATIVKQPNWPTLWRGFVRSNYITALWNWFLGLAGKAAEPVLFGSVLYSGAKATGRVVAGTIKHVNAAARRRDRLAERERRARVAEREKKLGLRKKVRRRKR